MEVACNIFGSIDTLFEVVYDMPAKSIVFAVT